MLNDENEKENKQKKRILTCVNPLSLWLESFDQKQ
jgi:hypothetical protein